MNDSKTRAIKAPTGTTLQARSWLTEAPLRMIMNNLDPQVAERPEDLVVYGGIGKAARNWECFDAIVATLKELGDDETLLVQSGKPVGVFRTHADAPRVLVGDRLEQMRGRRGAAPDQPALRALVPRKRDLGLDPRRRRATATGFGSRSTDYSTGIWVLRYAITL